MQYAQKLAELEASFDDLSVQMSDPALIGDQAEYTKVAKRHRDLEEVVTKYREWKQVNENIHQGIAWHIGNRHLAAEIGDHSIRIRADHVIAQMVEGLGGHVHEIEAPFNPEGGAYGGPAPAHEHAHIDGHAHGHSHG